MLFHPSIKKLRRNLLVWSELWKVELVLSFVRRETSGHEFLGIGTGAATATVPLNQ